jgi:hypothetical protein
MAILGLTHDEHGMALEKLPVAIKVAIGEVPTPMRTVSRRRCFISFSSGRPGAFGAFDRAQEHRAFGSPQSLRRRSQSRTRPAQLI